ncbi:MAG: LysR family transcriptional regulator [Anaerobacillus sp.]
MTIEQLEYIVKVANTGLLSQASEELHVSLSAVSQSISKLEKELGFQLFIRNRSGAVPTPQGQKIILKAKEIVRKMEELREEANRQLDTLNGELKIATIPGPISLMIDTVSQFKLDYPNVKLEIYENGPVKIIEEVYQNRLDIGLILISDSLIQKHKTLAFEKIMEGKMVAGINKQSPLSRMKKISPADLLNETLVLYDDDYINEYVMNTLSSYGPIDLLFTTNNTDAIKTAVQRGIAVTLGLDYSFSSNKSMREQDIMMVDIEGGDQEKVYLALVRNKSGQTSPAVKEFMSRINKDF